MTAVAAKLWAKGQRRTVGLQLFRSVSSRYSTLTLMIIDKQLLTCFGGSRSFSSADNLDNYQPASKLEDTCIRIVQS